MPHDSQITFVGRGDQGAATLRVRASQLVSAPAAGGDLLIWRLATHNMKTMELRFWAEAESVDFTLARRLGTNADGSPIWEDVAATATRTAAADPNDVQAAEITLVTVAAINADEYAIFASRTADPDDGTLHVFGSAKA